MMFKHHSRVAGFFRLERHHVDSKGNEIPGSRCALAEWFPNLVLNSGLDNMAEAGFIQFCRLGTGNSTPDVGQTSLDSQLAGQSGSIVDGPVGEDYVSILGTYVFPQGAAEGIIAEIGVGPTANGLLTSRALILDANGDPTTVTVTDIDILTVTYQLREYPDQSTASYVVSDPVSNIDYDVQSRTLLGLHPSRLRIWHQHGPIRNISGGTSGLSGYRLQAASGSLVAWDSTSHPTGGLGHGTVSPSAYSSGNYYRDMSFTFETTWGNVVGGIVTLSLGWAATSSPQSFFFQAQFDPPIDKDNTKTLTGTLRKSWGRYEP